MKTTAFASTLGLGAGLAALLAMSACAPVTQPRDTGNMAFPAPLPQGNVGPGLGTTAQRIPDTGNMAYPAPLPQGNLSTTATGGPRRPTDTGNMAYPAPVPAGNIGTTRLSR